MHEFSNLALRELLDLIPSLHLVPSLGWHWCTWRSSPSLHLLFLLSRTVCPSCCMSLFACIKMRKTHWSSSNYFKICLFKSLTLITSFWRLKSFHLLPLFTSGLLHTISNLPYMYLFGRYKHYFFWVLPPPPPQVNIFSITFICGVRGGGGGSKYLLAYTCNSSFQIGTFALIEPVKRNWASFIYKTSMLSIKPVLLERMSLCFTFCTSLKICHPLSPLGLDHTTEWIWCFIYHMEIMNNYY